MKHYYPVSKAPAEIYISLVSVRAVPHRNHAVGWLVEFLLRVFYFFLILIRIKDTKNKFNPRKAKALISE